MIRHEPLRADADRDRILFAAAHLFREYGFDKTTVRQIAEACDLLPGSLHYRYRAKEDILVDMMRAAIEKTILGIT
ncbi:TetR/AcrR family transcriptional regulator, partial [Lacticaseibacillus paracasei]